VQCKVIVGPNPPVTGGDPPDGTYDFVSLVSQFPQVDDNCGSQALRIDRGVFFWVAHDLGGPSINSGTVSFDRVAKNARFVYVCGSDPAPSRDMPYSYDAATKVLTVFYFSTPWNYRLR